MGAAAGVFSGVTSAVVRQAKRMFSYAWEHPLVTVGVVMAAGLIIAFVEMLKSRTSRK